MQGRNHSEHCYSIFHFNIADNEGRTAVAEESKHSWHRHTTELADNGQSNVTASDMLWGGISPLFYLDLKPKHTYIRKAAE
jgi:hypothetical protein